MRDVRQRQLTASFDRRQRGVSVLAESAGVLPEHVRLFLTERLDQDWVLELLDYRARLPQAAWLQWCQLAMTEGRDYPTAVRRMATRQSNLQLADAASPTPPQIQQYGASGGGGGGERYMVISPRRRSTLRLQ